MEGEGGGRESRKVAVISQNRQRQWERVEIEANKFPSRGLRGSLSNNRLFCRPRHVPLWDLLWKRFTNIISTATPSISESGRGPLAAFLLLLLLPHLGLGGDNSWRDSASRSRSMKSTGGKGGASSVIEILFTLKGRKSARGIYVEAGTGERGDL